MKKTILVLMVMLGLSPFLYSAEIIVAPVPWVPGDAKASRGNLSEGIKFRNLPSEGEILIYTSAGDLVKQISLTSGGNASWSGKNEGGEYVASGVYLWVVKSSGFTKTGKLIVVR